MNPLAAIPTIKHTEFSDGRSGVGLILPFRNNFLIIFEVEVLKNNEIYEEHTLLGRMYVFTFLSH